MNEIITDEMSENKEFAIIEELINEFSNLIASFCPGEIPDLGAMLNLLDQLIVQADVCDAETLSKVANACKAYVENMTLENITNIRPIEEALILLKALSRHLNRGSDFIFETADILELLEVSIDPSQIELPGEGNTNTTEIDVPLPQESGIRREISNDDMEILIDFVSEAEDNLDSIEINLIELEQDPSNVEIINNIFRPFHTVKGVSGFLSLNKINVISHATENLLDGARSGDFLINERATDIILESVDLLKVLLDLVKQGTQTGIMPGDDHIDVENLRERLQKIQITLTAGEKEPLGEILVRKGAIKEEIIESALDSQKASPDKKIGEILVEEQGVAPRQVASALMDQTIKKRQNSTQVKVSTQKLDDLVDYAGELVIAQSMLRQQTTNDTTLSQSIAQLGQIVSNMQNIAMSMRMIPIKTTFMKMIRLVRDLSRKTNKEINLVMEGEETEIDRNVVDALYEPMVHMIRNSVDHGIETNEDRRKTDKPLQGSITLRAYHKGGNIIIEIEDDGKGLDKDKIIEKAMSTGLITGSEQMTDAQAYDLIMQPGFSTAKEITDVSGRGVGMDVVKDGIEKFRGQLTIESEMNKGTRFTISLPLTLAIIDGMLVKVDNEKYVIPTIAIQKAFKPEKQDYSTVAGQGEMVKEMGDLIPIIRLNELYNSNTKKKKLSDSLIVVVEAKGEKKALLIDDLLGKDEFVIKNLGGQLEHIKGIAGGAILSNGKVGLILDIHGLFSIASEKG